MDSTLTKANLFLGVKKGRCWWRLLLTSLNLSLTFFVLRVQNCTHNYRPIWVNREHMTFLKQRFRKRSIENLDNIKRLLLLVRKIHLTCLRNPCVPTPLCEWDKKPFSLIKFAVSITEQCIPSPASSRRSAACPVLSSRWESRAPASSGPCTSREWRPQALGARERHARSAVEQRPAPVASRSSS